MDIEIRNRNCIGDLSKMPDKSVDLLLTDPPYGIGINKMNFVTSGAIKVGGAYRNDYSNHNTEWDEQPPSKDVIMDMLRVTKNQIIFGANHFANLLPNTKGWVVWDKRCEDKYNNDFADCELIWTSFDKPARIIRYLWSGMLQQDMKNKEKRVHPTQKPVAVIRKLLEMFSGEGQLVLDPFGGSGSVAVACKQIGRRCITYEINPQYCEIANGRLKQQTLTAIQNIA